MLLDIFSRYVVGWAVAAREDAQIATELIAGAVNVHGAPAAVHADRGTSMTSKPVAQLLVDLGVARSHSRPHCSNDNPSSEAQFTMTTASGRSSLRPRIRLVDAVGCPPLVHGALDAVAGGGAAGRGEVKAGVERLAGEGCRFDHQPLR